MLITQDQPANSGYPERDWVWELDGHHLRPIAHYAAHDAAQVIAIAWQTACARCRAIATADEMLASTWMQSLGL